LNYDIKDIIKDAPDNFVIQGALCRCYEIIESHSKIICLISGGADSDVVLDMIIRCGGAEITDFVFIDTGLEYEATRDHLKFLEEKYGIVIHRKRAVKSIPTCVREYGVPFWSKYASEMIYRLQLHDFQWEDEPYEVLMRRYPNCKTALGWWCNISKGTSMYTIDRAPFLKEFMIQNPPTFKISNKCCDYAKKKTSAEFQKHKGYDLCCIGVRKSEGGIRVTHKTCFYEREGTNQFMPIFWLSDTDKAEYCDHYEITHSRCYTEYGLQRTGCFGCPFGKRFEEELLGIESYEPRLLKAANSIFGQSYEYTRKYLAFRDEMKQKQSADL
jgi:3'-phosphoadenosine 5'-phosphosulfate sulfotransferase (PAPS reductase)/FAD synthetase